MTPSWDQPVEPHPYASAGTADSGPTANSVDDLPAVARLTAEGWSLVPPAPLWFALLSVWPAEARTWVPDRVNHHETRWTNDGAAREVPWSSELRDEVRAASIEGMAEAGLPLPPDFRIWLVQVPKRFADLDTLFRAVVSDANSNHVDTADLATFAAFAEHWLREATA